MKTEFRTIKPENPNNYPFKWKSEPFIGTRFSLAGEESNIDDPDIEPLIITEIPKITFHRFAEYTTGKEHEAFEVLFKILDSSIYYMVLENKEDEEIYCVASWKGTICVFGKLVKESFIYNKIIKSIKSKKLKVVMKAINA